MHFAGQFFRGTDSLSFSCPGERPADHASRGESGIDGQPAALRREPAFGIKGDRLPLGDAADTGTL